MGKRAERAAKKYQEREALKACVFCGEFRRMSKEHIWGDWVRDFIPERKGGHTLRDVEIMKSSEPEKVSIIQRKGSALGTFRHIVCEPCNTQWMSRLQNNAKDYLIPLFKGDPTVLGQEACSAVAAWATMVSMTAEFMLDSGTKIGISREDRAALMTTEAPLPDWKIWVGYYDGGIWSHQWKHASLPIVGGKDLPSAEYVYTPLPNTQTTTFVVGKLYVHTMSCGYPDVVSNWQWLLNNRLRNLLVPIWPVRPQIVTWPIHGVNDADVQLSSEMFIRWTEQIAHETGF